MIVGSPTKLNLIPSGVMPVVYINQGDAGYDKEFLIYNGDSPYNVPAGVSATIRGKKADGYGVTEAAALTEGSNLVTVTITEQMVAAAGENLYELVFVDTDGLRIATINMVWAVKADALGDAVISDSDLDYASQVMDQLQSVAAFQNQLDNNTSGLAAEIAARIAAGDTERAARIAADNTLQSNIDAEINTRSRQDAVLSARMDTFSSLPSGSTSGNAELLDIRVAADGSTYPSAGDAVRGQVGDLQDSVNLVKTWGGLGYITQYAKLCNVNTKAEVNFANGAFFYCTPPASCSMLKVSARTQGSDNAYPLFCFFDVNDNIISKYGSPTTVYTDELVSIPGETAYFICNYSLEQNASFDISGLYIGNDSFDDLKTWAGLLYSLVAGKVMNVNTRTEVTLPTGAYFMCDLPVSCSKLKISALSNGSDNAYPLLCFFDSNDVILGKFGEASKTYTDRVIGVPKGTSYIICNYSTQNGASFSISAFYIELNEDAKNKIYYQLANEELYVSTRYNTSNDFVVLLRKKGGNSLMDFGTFYLNPNTEKHPKSNLSSKELLYETGSDYHGPMVVRTVNNRNGDNPYSQYWTGGNHQYNNTGVGSTPTARCVNVKFFVDGAETTEGHGYCSDVRITWTNYVQSYSTTKADGSGREVIRENHELYFDGLTWHSYVELIALEDVIFQKYYGFQYGGIASIYPDVRFIGATNRLEYDAQTVDADSGDKSCSMIKGFGSTHEIIMQLDTAFDLGKREQYSGLQGAFTKTYGKGYFYVIGNASTDDANYRVNAGELIAMRGSYSFIPSA